MILIMTMRIMMIIVIMIMLMIIFMMIRIMMIIIMMMTQIMLIIILMMTQMMMMMMMMMMTCSAHPAPSIRRVNNQGLALHLGVKGWKTNGRMTTALLL